MSINAATIVDCILRLAGERGSASSICPSDVARSLAENWRPLLGPVRREAAGLARAGQIDILRKGKAIDPVALKGVIRLRIRQGVAAENGSPQDGTAESGSSD